MHPVLRYMHIRMQGTISGVALLIGLKAELGYWIFIYRSDMARPTNVMHSRTFVMCMCVCVYVHIYSYVYSPFVVAICVVSGHTLCDLLCINLRCVYITRGLQDNDRSMRHARINGPHGYTVYCTHRGPLSVYPLVFSPLPPLFLLSRNA